MAQLGSALDWGLSAVASRQPKITKQRVVAQLGSAPDWGSGGRRFKSCQPDEKALMRSYFSSRLLSFLVGSEMPQLVQNGARARFRRLSPILLVKDLVGQLVAARRETEVRETRRDPTMGRVRVRHAQRPTHPRRPRRTHHRWCLLPRRRTAPRPRSRNLAQLAHRSTRQTLTHRLRPLNPIGLTHLALSATGVTN